MEYYSAIKEWNPVICEILFCETGDQIYLIWYKHYTMYVSQHHIVQEYCFNASVKDKLNKEKEEMFNVTYIFISYYLSWVW
jgi:hypothetical protein